MSGRPARSSEASPTRLLVLDDGAAHDVFEVVAATATVIQVRSAFLFEVGEELGVRIEQDGATSEATARVRGHAGPAEARVTELEIFDRSEPRGQGRLMRVAELDEVTYDLEVDGEEVRRTLHRRVWERGAWATVAIAYEERGAEGWKPAKLALIRLQRVRGAWKKHAAVTLAGGDALDLAATVAGWSALAAAPDGEADDSSDGDGGDD